jgi:hypothetical protein
MGSVYNRLIRGKKTTPATATATASAVPAPQQPEVSKEVFDTNANKALDAICNTPNIKSDLLNLTYNLKDDDRGQLINVLNSDNNKLKYDKIKADIRSEIERSRPEEDLRRGIRASSSLSPPPPSMELSEEDLRRGRGIRASSSPESPRPPPPSREPPKENGAAFYADSIMSDAVNSATAAADERDVNRAMPSFSKDELERQQNPNRQSAYPRPPPPAAATTDVGPGASGGRRRTKKSKYYNKRRRTKGRRTKGRRVKRRRSNKRRN